MKLYVIGNGFDLHHSLQTSYFHFSVFLKQNNSEIYNLLESYINFPISDKDLWSRFEENLANLDYSYLLSDNSDFLPDVANDDFRDRDRYAFEDVMTRIKDLLTDTLLSLFREFILAVEIPKKANEKMIDLDEDALFLSFNYTDTLEALYNVGPSNITYIHNAAKSDHEYIVLGHGRNPTEYEEKLLEHPADLPTEDIEEWYEQNIKYDPFYDPGKEALMQYFTKMYKPTMQIISEHDYFFSKLKKVDEIVILGHSLSNVDLPYFEEIHKNARDVKWTVSYFSAADMNV
jgi:hypothetical protein